MSRRRAEKPGQFFGVEEPPYLQSRTARVWEQAYTTEVVYRRPRVFFSYLLIGDVESLVTTPIRRSKRFNDGRREDIHEVAKARQTETKHSNVGDDKSIQRQIDAQNAKIRMRPARYSTQPRVEQRENVSFQLTESSNRRRQHRRQRSSSSQQTLVAEPELIIQFGRLRLDDKKSKQQCGRCGQVIS